MPPPPNAPFHIGLTADRVIDAAFELTAESHLFSWSIRNLAQRLNVAASVIYHHVGGKDLLCRRVVERVLRGIELPAADLDWQDWFRQLLYDAGPLVKRYPGVAKWMLMHGPTIPAALPILESGMGALYRAGFGERATFAYAALFNTAMMTVSVGDDRLQHEGDGPRDHANMMAEFELMPTASEQVQAIGNEFLRPFALGGEGSARMYSSYYRFAIDTTIAGLEAVLATHGHPAIPATEQEHLP